MKLKQSGLKVSVAAFCAAAVIALPLRTYQFFTVLEPGTGFYSKIGFPVVALYCVLAVAIIVFTASAFASRKTCGYVTEAQKRPGQGILSLFTAATLLMDAVSCYSLYDSGLEGYLSMDAASAVIGTKIIAAQCIAAVACAIFFVASGISMLTGKSTGSEFKILSLTPAAWCIMRMIFRFTRTISYIRVSDLFFELVMLVFMVLFFMAFAQVNSRIGDEGIEWKIPGYGLPASLMALVCFVPRLIVTVSGNTEMLYEQSPAEYCDFAVALLIVCIVFTRTGKKAPAPVSVEQTGEEVAQVPLSEE